MYSILVSLVCPPNKVAFCFVRLKAFIATGQAEALDLVSEGMKLALAASFLFEDDQVRELDFYQLFGVSQPLWEYVDMIAVYILHVYVYFLRYRKQTMATSTHFLFEAAEESWTLV